MSAQHHAAAPVKARGVLYTVIGVWLGDTPTVVGVVAGDHQVSGGNQRAFPDGLWATCVPAAGVEQAEQRATAQMRASL